MAISAIVLTKNNEDLIEPCLKSLAFCSEIIIVDDFSTDSTEEKISQMKKNGIGITTYRYHLDNDFSGARNFALSKAAQDWLLFIDSDEIVSDDLAQEILQKTSDDLYDGYYIRRTDTFMGKTLHYGETGNIKFVRLAKKGKGVWKGRVHEEWAIDGRTSTLKNQIVHNHNQTISQHLQKIDRYTTIRAQEMYKDGVREPIAYHLLKPAAKFIQNYILRLGFLDGFEGLAMAWLMSWHSLLVRMKLKLLYIDNPLLFKKGKAER